MNDDHQYYVCNTGRIYGAEMADGGFTIDPEFLPLCDCELICKHTGKSINMNTDSTGVVK